MPPKPRIALCMEYPVAQAGGVEVLAVELVRGLASEFSVVLVSDDSADSLAASGLAPLIVRHFPWRFGRGTAAEAKNLAVALKEDGVALAHFHFGGTYAWRSRFAPQCPIPAAARLGIQVVITNHFAQLPLEGFCSASSPLWFKLALFPMAWCSRLGVLSCARRDFTVFLYDRKLARGIFWPLRNKIGHMYHSILDEQEPVPPLTADCRPPIILSVGTVTPRKNQRVLVEAFDRIAAKHPEWILRLTGYVGDKDYYQGIQNMQAAKRLAGRLEFTGPLSRVETARAMCGASIFFGQGLALQEALFRGCACLGISAISTPELIEHGRTGLLAPPDNPGALAEALGELIAQPALRRQLTDQGRASIIAKGMTRQRMIRRHVDLYHTLLTDQT